MDTNAEVNAIKAWIAKKRKYIDSRSSIGTATSALMRALDALEADLKWFERMDFVDRIHTMAVKLGVAK
jgi:hypothetical protein